MLSTKEQTTQDVGKRQWNALKRELEKRNMSIYRFSQITGIPRTQIYALKNRRQKTFGWEYMVKIADVLDMSLDIFR